MELWPVREDGAERATEGFEGIKSGCKEGGADEREARAEADVVVSACDTESDGDWTVGRGRSRQSEVRQKGLTKSEGCEGSGGESFVGEKLEGIRVGKA